MAAGDVRGRRDDGQGPHRPLHTHGLDAGTHGRRAEAVRGGLPDPKQAPHECAEVCCRAAHPLVGGERQPHGASA